MTEHQLVESDNGLLMIAGAIVIMYATYRLVKYIINQFSSCEDISTINSAESYSRTLNKSEKL
jgi:hypothetical protein